jgi:hypothetical protein
MSSVRDRARQAAQTAAGDTVTVPEQSRRPGTRYTIWAVVAVLVIGVAALGVYEEFFNKAAEQIAQPPPVPTKKVTTYNGVDVTTVDSGNVRTQRQTMRIVSAPTDLTGRSELGWAADKGVAVGAVRCTQNFQFSANALPGIRPTLLLCWRTSKTKSVYTLAVNLDTKPSTADSETLINDKWDAMG